jgi:hypothetical protein
LYRAIAALNEGRAILEQLSTSTRSFAEISESPIFAQVAENFKGLQNADDKYAGFYTMFITIFTQKVGIQANQTMVARIV